MSSVFDYIPNNAEIGVGLALQTEKNKYIFFLPGSRHKLPPNELFYAGIGGHLEEGESLIECAQRESIEEIDSKITILSSSIDTLYISSNNNFKSINITDIPKPVAIYEMIHPTGSPNEGNIYHIIIFSARLEEIPAKLKLDEVQALIALTKEQVKLNVKRTITIEELLEEGAELVVGGNTINPKTKIYPIGTAKALGYVFQQLDNE